MSAESATPVAPPAPFGGAAPGHVPRELVKTFDYVTAPGFLADPYGRFSDTVEGQPRVFFTPGSAGGWMVSRFDDVREVLQNTEIFSSRGIASNVPRDDDDDGGFALIPLELDPPRHGRYRMMLNPVFAPKEIDRLEDDIRAVAIRLIEAMRADGECEFVAAFARPLPTTIFVHMMGLPQERADQFVDWTIELIHSHDRAREQAATQAIMGVLHGLVAERRQAPRDDIISRIVALRLDGEPLSDADILGFCFLLFIAGLDTVTSTLTNIFRFLAENDDYRRQLAADPALIPDAVEELLRAFAVVTTSRFVTRDAEVLGVTMKKGDRVTVLLPSANRDPAEFDEPRAVRIAREHNRHITFSAGPHRCIGSHLARRELRITLEEFLRRIPDFAIDPAEPLQMYGGGVIGHHRLGLTW